MLRIFELGIIPLPNPFECMGSASSELQQIVNKLFESLSDFSTLTISLLSARLPNPSSLTESLSVRNALSVKLFPDLVEDPLTVPSKPLTKWVADKVMQQVAGTLPSKASGLLSQVLNQLSIEGVQWDNNTGTGELKIKLHEHMQGSLSIALSSDTTQSSEMRTFLQKALAENTMTPDLIKVLLQNLPSSYAVLTWDGLRNNLILTATLENVGVIRLNLDVTPTKSIEIFSQLLPESANMLLPIISPLIVETFNIAWDGKSSNMQISFEHPQELILHAAALESDGFLSKLLKNLISNIKLVIPQRINLMVDPETNQVTFNEGVGFKVKKGIFSKGITLNQLSLNSQSNKLSIDLRCFGLHKIHFDLPQNLSGNETAPLPVPATQIKGQELLVSTILKFFKIDSIHWDHKTQIGTLDVQLDEQVKGKLSIELLEPTAKTTSVEIHPFIKAALSKLSTDPMLTAFLLKNLPLSQANIQWKGSSNKLHIDVTIPNAAHIKLELDISLEKVLTLFPSLEKVISKEALEILQGLKPLMRETFSLNWDGKTSNIQLNFNRALEIEINEVLLAKMGFLRDVVKGVTKHVKIALPSHFEATVDLKALELKFENVTRFFVKKGIMSKKVTLHQMAFDPEKQALDIDLTCFGKQSLHLDLTKSDVEKLKLGLHTIS